MKGPRIRATSVLVSLFLLIVLGLGTAIAKVERTAYLASRAPSTPIRDVTLDVWADGKPTPPPVTEGVPVRTGTAISFGPTGGAKALVLYDTGGQFPATAETNGLAAAQLATHFGRVTAKPVGDYAAGELRLYDALLYVGTDYQKSLPTALIDDVVGGTVPVVWAGANVAVLAGRTETDVAPTARQQAFVAKYGWDPIASAVDATSTFPAVRYKGQDLARDAENLTGGLFVPQIRTASAVTVLAEALCGTPGPARCAGNRGATTSVPWAVRSANLTYVAESPFSYVTEGGHYLVYADLLYDALGRQKTPVRQAAVRLEDVSPISDPDTIRRYADYLSSEGVPFQIAVVPNFVDRKGTTLSGEPRNLSLSDMPKLVDALKYAQSRGGVLIQHGTTHQYGNLDNPYSGATGDDFEFFKAGCSDSPKPPYDLVTCADNTAVQLLGPLENDEEDDAARRVAGGRHLFDQAGLGTPTVFETPHYTASPAAYRAIRRVYPVRYERGLYTDGLLTGKPSTGYIVDQYFPYAVTDVFGSKVLPENLGSFAPKSYSGHAVHTTADIVTAARANLVVRESTASFFFHPFLPIENLQEIVRGIKDAGYTFLPAEQLR